MNLRPIILYLCLIISTGSLVAGYFLSGYWQVLPVLLIMLIFGILTKIRFWSASGLLLVYIVLAAIGVIAGFSVGLMIIACTFALSSWELIHFEQSHGENPPRLSSAQLEKNHWQALAGAATIGLLLAFISSYISLELPFGVIVSLVLIAMGGLMFSLQHIVKKNL